MMGRLKFSVIFAFVFLLTAGNLYAAEYVAFSLKAAQDRTISTPKGKDFRKVHPEASTLGNITKIRGLVYDRENKDIILVGERGSERSILTLDDLVVALRARFVYGKWPLVSIDPTPDTQKTNMQIVRFEGGIEETQFGKDLLNAHCRLVQLAEGLIPSGVEEVKSYRDLYTEEAQKHSGVSYKINSRFWFYPVLPSVSVRKDVVAIKGSKVGVFTEVLSAEIDGKKIGDLSTFRDEAAERFAKMVSGNFENIALTHPVFSRLQSLNEIVLLTRAIEEMDKKPDLSFWLKHYQAGKVKTQREINVLTSVERYEAQKTNELYERYPAFPISDHIAERLKTGDVTALKDAALETRPSPNAMIWSFMVKEGIASTLKGKMAAPRESTGREERMKPHPSPGEYVAFSLKVAQKMITDVGTGQNYRVVYPEAYDLGGINQIHGLVYDRSENDTILVGKYNPDRQSLTLDDLAVALKARFIHGKWPLVSIDPTEETKKTEMQTVRFQGGIEETQFGQDLFDADYRLKRIGMGLLAPGIPGLKTYWDLGMERAKEGAGGSHKINSRFWFYPVLPSVSVREDVVAIKGLKVGVFTEVLSAEIDGEKIEDLSTFQDPSGDRFAMGVSDNFEALAEVHPSFSRVQGLDELVALTKAIGDMDERPDLSFWLKDYRVTKVEMEKELKVLRRHEEYEVPTGRGVYRGSLEFSGGVQLMAIALRLKAGDVTALKEAVLKTRPKPDALSWSFVVGEWLIPTTPGMLDMEDVAPLFMQAVFLQEKGHYDDAITLYGKIIELKPDWDWVYNNRGEAYTRKGEYDQAISDYNTALEIDPRLAGAYSNRGRTYYYKGLYDQAIADYSRALEINPRDAEVHSNRGVAYYSKGQYDEAISDYNEALKINPRDDAAYTNRGEVYRFKGLYDQAISDLSKAIEINPRLAEAYYNRAKAYAHKGKYDHAIPDFSKAIEINPRDAMAYNNRGAAYAQGKGEYDRAISDYNKAIEIDPRYAEAYNNRGGAYHDRGEYDRAISDFNKAIKIKPRYAMAYYNRGIAHAEGKGEYDRAISDFSKAIEIKPKDAVPHWNRGLAYADKGQYDQAISDYNKAIEINPRDANAYYNRGNAYAQGKGEYDQAIFDYSKAIEINPRYANAYNNRGAAYRDKGEYDRAISDLSKAIEIDPRLAEAYYNRAKAYAHQGKYDQAISDFSSIIGIKPRDAVAYCNRADAYFDKGQYNQAIHDYGKALEMNPSSAEVYNNRGLAYARGKGQYDRAISDFSEAIKINPGLAEAYSNRGLAYAEKGQYDQAISDHNKAIEINPRDAVAYFNKALACEKLGCIKEAIQAYRRFIQYASPRYAPHIERARQKIKELER